MKDSYYSLPTIKEKKQKRKLSASLYYTQPFCACNLFLITTHFILNKLSVTMQGIRKRTRQVSAVENHRLRSVTLFRLEIDPPPPPPASPFCFERLIYQWSLPSSPYIKTSDLLPSWVLRCSPGGQFICGRQKEPAILFSMFLLRMRRMYVASIRLYFHYKWMKSTKRCLITCVWTFYHP